MHPSHTAELAAGHYHYTILASFVMGYFLHVWVQTSSIARAHPDPTVNTNYVVAQNSPRLAWRFFISLMIFLTIWSNPSTAPALLGAVGFTLSDNYVALLSLPMTVPIAGGMGVFIDVFLGFIPVLKNALPAIEFSQTKIKSEQVLAGGNKVVEETKETTRTVSQLPINKADSAKIDGVEVPKKEVE